MKKIKESWNEFSLGQKIGTGLIGICIIAVIIASCSKYITADKSDNNQSNTKQNQQITKPVIEEEPTEDRNPKPELGLNEKQINII